MSEPATEVIMKRFDEGVKKIEEEKLIEGIRDIRLVLSSYWIFLRNADGLMADLTFYVCESRLKKLKDDKEVIKRFSQTLKNLKEGLMKGDEMLIYRNLKEMVSCVMERVPVVEKE